MKQRKQQRTPDQQQQQPHNPGQKNPHQERTPGQNQPCTCPQHPHKSNC